MGAIGRWGNSLDLDFWTACEAGQVDAPEVRAVDLLRRTTDAERFHYYCQTGMLPAMGNMTRRIYMVLRGGAALELEDGKVVGSWCISIGPHSLSIPGTDQVVVLRNLLEGEEMEFMKIGNRSPVGENRPEHWLYGVMNLHDWLPDIYRETLLEEPHDPENAEMLGLEEVRANDWFDRDGGPRVYGMPVAGQARALFYHQGMQDAMGEMEENQKQEQHAEDLMDDGEDIGNEDDEAYVNLTITPTLGGGAYVQWPDGIAEYVEPPQGLGDYVQVQPVLRPMPDGRLVPL